MAVEAFLFWHGFRKRDWFRASSLELVLTPGVDPKPRTVTRAALTRSPCFWFRSLTLPKAYKQINFPLRLRERFSSKKAAAGMKHGLVAGAARQRRG